MSKQSVTQSSQVDTQSTSKKNVVQSAFVFTFHKKIEKAFQVPCNNYP